MIDLIRKTGERMETNEQMRTEFLFFGEVWTLFKKFYNVQSEDSYWESLIESASEINKKYNCKLCRDLLIAVLNELDRKGRDLGG